MQIEKHFFFFSVNKATKSSSKPITAKMRVFSDIEKTVKYARMIERAGASIIGVSCLILFYF